MIGGGFDARKCILLDAFSLEAMCEAITSFFAGNVGLVVQTLLPILIRILLAIFGHDTIEVVGEFCVFVNCLDVNIFGYVRMAQ